jgi:hypothetical protein
MDKYQILRTLSSPSRPLPYIRSHEVDNDHPLRHYGPRRP